jgi:TolB-like protein/DNA-binding winged helix-turn-helix (wHTH) protein/Flp pilus assembly protein TadD
MPSAISHLYGFGEFLLDAQSRVLRLRDEPIALTPKAFDVLLLLIRRNGQIVSKDELMDAVWPDSFVEESNLTQTVFMLRKALGESSSQRYILTVQGRGYRFAPEVKSRDFKPIVEAAIPQEYASQRAHDLGAPLSVSTTKPVVPVKRKMKRAALAVAALALAVSALALWLAPAFSRRANAGLPVRSIAVLPLDNFSGDPSQEFFVDGMTDELTTDLAKVSSLHVISRTSVMRYKGTKKTLPEIARELNVDGIVEGSVMRSGQRVRITAQLIHAPSDRHLWAETYERDLGDALKLQSEVAEAIALKVRVQLTPQQQASLHSARSVNPEAYDAYLRGRYFLSNQFTTAQPLNEAKGYFEEAIRKDPDFALAYSGLADSYVYLAFFRQVPRDRAYVAAKEALRKAQALDDNIGEVHSTLGLLSWRFDWDLDTAEKEFNRAIEVAPSYSCAREERANFLAFVGRRAEALAESENNDKIDPGPSSAMSKAAIYYQLRDYQGLLEAGRKGVASNPNEWTQHANLGAGFEGTGKLLEAIAEFQQAVELSDGDQDATASLADAYAKIGRKAEAEKILLDLQRRSKTVNVSPYTIATVYAGLGNKDKSLEFLEKAFREKSLEASWHLKADRRLDNLRSDPRFQSLLRGARLP